MHSPMTHEPKHCALKRTLQGQEQGTTTHVVMQMCRYAINVDGKAKSPYLCSMAVQNCTSKQKQHRCRYLRNRGSIFGKILQLFIGSVCTSPTSVFSSQERPDAGVRHHICHKHFRWRKGLKQGRHPRNPLRTTAQVLENDSNVLGSHSCDSHNLDCNDVPKHDGNTRVAVPRRAHRLHSNQRSGTFHFQNRQTRGQPALA